jgi:hypothetical protein
LLHGRYSEVHLTRREIIVKSRLFFLVFFFLILLSSPTHSVDVRQWEADFWSEMRSGSTPWLWALSLHNLSGLALDKDQSDEAIEVVTDKLLAHPSPGAESLYWAALACANVERRKNTCRVPELVKRLMEVDGENIYSFAIYYDTELSHKFKPNGTSDEPSDWSYFDSWLERAVGLNKVESYDFFHFGEMVRILVEHGQTEGVPSYLQDAPLEWKASFYIIDNSFYPWFGITGRIGLQCKRALSAGRLKTVDLCRTLAEKLINNSKSILARSDALLILAETYSKKEPEFIRYKREAVAWPESVRYCLNRMWKFSEQKWPVRYDAHEFADDFDSNGEIAALRGLAESEGWVYRDNDGGSYQCTDTLDLDDEALIRFMGKDPAWQWCGNGDLCDLPTLIDQ